MNVTQKVLVATQAEGGEIEVIELAEFVKSLKQ